MGADEVIVTEVIEIEMFVMVDADGYWEAGADEGQLAERYAETVGDVPPVNRVLRVKLTLPKPKPVEVAVAVDLPDETPAVTVKVA